MGNLWWKVASVKLEFKPQDAWIGVYWQHDQYALHVWVCVIPMLPIHVVIL